MYRVAFPADASGDRHQLAQALHRCTLAEARIVAAFAGVGTVEVYLDIVGTAVPRAVAGQLAQRLGVSEYDVIRVDALPVADLGDDTGHRSHLRPATITQVRTGSDGYTLSVQARHRPHETVETIDVEESDDSVTVAVFVTALDDDVQQQFVSLAVEFSWVEAVLARPVGARLVIPQDPEHGFLRSRPPGETDAVEIPEWMRGEVHIEPAAPAVQDLSAEEVLDRLERLAARRRADAVRGRPTLAASR